MRKHIAQAKSDSTPMLEEASLLVANKQESETKQAVLEGFTKHFIVADEDLDVLTSFAVPVNEQFFVVLNRVKKIHDDCEPLLGSENERLGLELMEQTSRNLDAGFKKLYNWVQRALKGLDFEDPQISGSIRYALRVLSERPTLFQSCLEFLAEARKHTLSDAFQRALSGQGDASGGAIEFSAHDLLRYMGDMLAWVHSTTVSEKESLEGLFIADAEAINRGMKSGRASEPWLQQGTESISNDQMELSDDTTFDGEKTLKELVSQSLTTICVTLRERIEIAVLQHDDVVLLFKAQNLLTFYHSLFAKLLTSTSALSTTIQRLEKATQDHLSQVLDTTDIDTSWTSDPIEGPMRHKENLRTLSALFAIKAPTEMASEQLEHFLKHYTGASRDYCQIVIRACTPPHADGYSVSSIRTAIWYATENVRDLRLHTSCEDEPAFEERYRDWPGALAMAEKLRLEKDLLRSLEEAMVDRLAREMLAVSGVAELWAEMEAAGAAVLGNLPDYAARLDEFLTAGYANIVLEVKPLDKIAMARKDDDGDDEPGEGSGMIEKLARARFLARLREVIDALEALGGEYREAYPRTMEEVVVLIE